MDRVIVKNFELCNGCGICEAVCSLHSTIECNPKKAFVRVIRKQDNGIRLSVPISCMQCERPLCQAICPVDAIHRSDETSAMVVDEERCVGCRACVYVCPFGAMSFDSIKRVATTCDLCGGDPLCAKNCPTKAIQYIDADSVDIKLKQDKASKLLGLRETLVQSGRG